MCFFAHCLSSKSILVIVYKTQPLPRWVLLIRSFDDTLPKLISFIKSSLTLSRPRFMANMPECAAFIIGRSLTYLVHGQSEEQVNVPHTFNARIMNENYLWCYYLPDGNELICCTRYCHEANNYGKSHCLSTLAPLDKSFHGDRNFQL